MKKKYEYKVSREGGKEFSADGLNPKKENIDLMRRTKQNKCPRCCENILNNIIDLGRGARECRTCGNYYLIPEQLRRSHL